MNTPQAAEWLPSFLVPFFTLSYPTEKPIYTDSFHDSAYFSTGLLDGCLIISYIAIMAILRDFTRIYVLEPFARWKLTRDWERSLRPTIDGTGTPNGSAANGCTVHTGKEDASPSMSKKQARKMHRSVLRFAEQGWSAIYYSIQFSYGLYVHCQLPTRVLNPTALWLNYPHAPLAGPLKLYYITQTAFYSHQMFILNAEARRKDHGQMMTHHVITVFLLVASYFTNYTRIGCLIAVIMDFSDILLPIAKMFRYIGLYTLCDITFGSFLVSWLITRHVLFVIAIKSAWFDSVRLVPENSWAPERGAYFSEITNNTFVSLLVFLEILQVVWFWMICRVAWRVLTGQGASDHRSDEEDIVEDKGD
ncbi:TLC domain-containing protein [Pisolithus orientalis]|uniref:TLC domain-containing protein n=1 Tax=Pisolithus orientalis TaxID=936130 RepID=UPI00222442FC|nr:TLC domain-containing protein [Pisolithus orientalis]KAI6035332.1 TLC domain-containing protein [Pisolithus orientalis]